eukprot:jgi/Botrbrau1/15425/Bobra.43_2s0051.1
MLSARRDSRRRLLVATLGQVCTLYCILGADATKSSNEAGVALQNGLQLSGDWGYINVRAGAHMFWWFEPCKGCPGQTLYEEPLVIWLQGGPGASGLYGLFTEVGPYEIGWKSRRHSWVQKANLLFVDNPVGTGFSYVEKGYNFARNNSEIVDDLMVFLREFVWAKPEFHRAPVYLVCESYGGKMGIEFAQRIVEGQKSGYLSINFKGVALGDSWIAPLDFVDSWVPALKAFSLIDDAQENRLSKTALETAQALRDGNGTAATLLWDVMEKSIENATDHVDFYNLLLHNVEDKASNSFRAASRRWLAQAPGDIPEAGEKLLARYHTDTLEEFINKDVKEALSYIIPDDVIWGKQAKLVFKNLAEDFMTDVVPTVSDVLTSGLPVTIYNGQLDLICCTLGVYQWLTRVNWTGMDEFKRAKPVAVHVDDEDDDDDDDEVDRYPGRRRSTGMLDIDTVGFYKSPCEFGNVHYSRCGTHGACRPAEAGLYLLSQILGEDDAGQAPQGIRWSFEAWPRRICVPMTWPPSCVPMTWPRYCIPMTWPLSWVLMTYNLLASQ